MAITKQDLGKKDLESRLNHARSAAPTVREMFPVIKNKKDYEIASALLEELVIQTRGKEDHELYVYLYPLSLIVGAYEKEHYPMDASPTEVLRFLMEQHNLKQSDLPEIGNQAKVSEVLAGKRALTPKHIKALAERFHVNPGAFI
jgi:HTH-type transcriptional regulator / antitoxin HigA